MQAPNRNVYWATIFVDELAKSGLRAVVIAPGSRSTPLAVAFSQHADITVYSVIDERGAGFFALGHALSTQKPVAVLCSSGTATANFYPAVIEAHYSNVPLLVITADRPHELRESGANQTIDQVKLFGDHVLWSVDAALPEANPPELAIRNLRTLANRAYHIADGLPRGPVHLNFPFRKPLEPIEVASEVREIPSGRADHKPFTHIQRGTLQLSDAQLDTLTTLIEAHTHGLIICGPRQRDDGFADAIQKLAKQAGYPILADPLSEVRFAQNPHEAVIIGSYDQFLTSKIEMPPIDLIIFFGAPPTSQALDTFCASQANALRIAFTDTGVWPDPNHLLDTLVWADTVSACQQLAERLPERASSTWATRWQTLDAHTQTVIHAEITASVFDGSAVHTAIQSMPAQSTIFIASSLPIRNLDQFVGTAQTAWQVFCNRGASGIDGTLSCAFGVAAGRVDHPTLLITGDLAFYHDLNGLLASQRLQIPLIILLINNDGGGIFRRLPIAQFEPPFTDLFLTPHGLTFEHSAAQFGFRYTDAESLEAVQKAVQTAVQNKESALIEVKTQSDTDLIERQRMTDTVRQQVTFPA